MTIWSACGGIENCIEMRVTPWRVVESQSVLTSRNLVDSIEEYEVLEDMLESSKPKTDKRTHYLLFTPFRYPPLKHGSRFGRKFEPSLWCGSLDLNTAFAEVAYYRLQFFQHTKAVLGFIHVPLTSFQAMVHTTRGIDLSLEPFNKYKEQIASSSSYEHSQVVGTDMRSSGVQAFIYLSARSLESGKNIGLFSPDVFRKKDGDYVFNLQTWHCTASKDSVDFVGQDKKALGFRLDNFMSISDSVAAF